MAGHAVDLAQAQARSTRSLGGEERIERLASDLRRHAVAGIADRHPHISARRRVVRPSAFEREVHRRDRQLAAIGHGVACVQAEIQQRGLDLAGIDHRRPQIGREIGDHPDTPSQRARGQGNQLRHQTVEVSGARGQTLPPGERQQPRGQVGAALHGAGRACDQRVQPVRVGFRHNLRHLSNAVLHQFQVAQDGREHVVEIVGDAARELSHGLELLCLMQGRLGLFALGDFDLQAVVDFRQRPCPPGDQRFQQFRLQTAFLIARLQAGSHGVEGLGERVEFRSAAGHAGAHVQIAVPPALRGQQQHFRRLINEAMAGLPSENQRHQRASTGKKYVPNDEGGKTGQRGWNPDRGYGPEAGGSSRGGDSRAQPPHALRRIDRELAGTRLGDQGT